MLLESFNNTENRPLCFIGGGLLTASSTLINGGSVNDVIASGIIGGISGRVGGNGAAYKIISPLFYSGIIYAANSAIGKGTIISLFFDHLKALHVRE